MVRDCTGGAGDIGSWSLCPRGGTCCSPPNICSSLPERGQGFITGEGDRLGLGQLGC